MYLWLKALHIIAVISWMAGLLYLPRLFVYHAMRAARLRAIGDLQGHGAPPAPLHHDAGDDRRPGSPGIALALAGHLLGVPWFHVKLALVLAMTVLHGLLGRWARDFAHDRNRHTR